MTRDEKTESKKLCSLCESLQPDDSNPVLSHDPDPGIKIGVAYEHHDTFPGLPILAVKAQAGCSFCGMLRHTILTKFGEELDKLSASPDLTRSSWLRVQNLKYIKDLVEMEKHGDSHYALESLTAEVDYAGRGLFKRVVGFNVYAEQGSCAARDLKIHRSPPNANPLSNKSIQWMKQWIRQCCTHHNDTCSQTVGRMPARLIDVVPTNPQLIETSQRRLKYAALSYCWGIPSTSNPHLKTLTINYESHQCGIYIDKMPKTLLDAVLVTRALGLQYLWIDALCIIQDNKADWEGEAVNMGQIYRGAGVTIVAAAATTSNEGFLSRPSNRMCAQIPYRSSTDNSIKGVFQLYERVLPHIDSDITVQASNWNTRAWTFQEQHLSTRALYFGTHVTHFQCQREMAAENSAVSSGFWPAPWVQELGVQDPARIKPDQRVRSIYDAWFDMVQDYSARILTVSSDKIPAVSSMANGVLAALKAAGRDDEFHAGLWRGDIICGLLWKGKYDVLDTERLSRPLAYRAPSWSWVSCDGQVHWPARWAEVRSECEVIDVETVVENATGQVSSGKITLSGKMRCVDGFHAYTEEDWKLRPDLAYSHAVIVDGRRVADGDIDCGGRGCEGRQIWTLLLASAVVDENERTQTNYVHGLLLQSADAHSFRRIGVFIVSEEGTHDFGFFDHTAAAIVSII